MLHGVGTTVFERFPLADPVADRPFIAAYWRDNVVVHARGRAVHYAEHTGPLSLKAVFAGEETYQLGRLRVVVDPERVLVINRGRAYASAIAARAPVESLSVFFRRGFVGGALAAAAEPSERLLDDPAAGADPELIERTYAASAVPPLHALRAARRREDPLWLDEQLHHLAAAVVAVDRGARREADRLAALRPATRLELYRRLCRARELIDSCYAEPLELAALAAVACLSPHHLLRQFAAAFGVTPARYLARRRVERAAARLAVSDAPIAAIAAAVGFASPAAFSRAVHRERGLSPREIRKRGKVARAAAR